MALLKDLTVFGASRLISDVFTNMISTTSSDLGTTAFNKVYVSNDNYIRYVSGANFMKGLFGSSAIGSPAVPIYWNGSTFATVQATFGNSSYGAHDANNINSNGLWYYTSNGPTTTQGASTADGALYSQAYNTSWVGQIAQDYRNGRLFVRGKNSGTWSDWRNVLDSFSIGLVATAGRFVIDPHYKKIINTTNRNSWDSEVYSTYGYTDNIVLSWKPGQTNKHIMVGLNSDPTTNTNYSSIDYCWYCNTSGSLQIYESSTAISVTGHSTYSVGDELRIEYSGGQIKYYHNDVLCRTVDRTVSGKLYLDSSFYDGGYVYDLTFTINNHKSSESYKSDKILVTQKSDSVEYPLVLTNNDGNSDYKDLFKNDHYIWYNPSKHSFGQGDGVTASGTNSSSMGYQTNATADRAHAEGDRTTASGKQSHAEGTQTVASGDSSHAEGNKSQANAQYSHAEGYQTKTTRNASHAEGEYTIASGYYSHGEGFSTTASGDAAHSEGYSTTASGYASHSEGQSTQASGNFSHAEGINTHSYSECSHSQGENTNAYGGASHAEGSRTYANGTSAHAEGSHTYAYGDHSHAEGHYTDAYGTDSHTEGSNTEARGSNSHAEGDHTKTKYNSSHAEGSYTAAEANYAHTEGYQTTSLGNAAHAEGHGNYLRSKKDCSKFYVYRSLTSTEKSNFNITGNYAYLVKMDWGLCDGYIYGDESHHNYFGEFQYKGYRYYNNSLYGEILCSTCSLSSNTYYWGVYHPENPKEIITGAHGDYSHTEGLNTTATGTAAHAEGYDNYLYDIEQIHVKVIPENIINDIFEETGITCNYLIKNNFIKNDSGSDSDEDSDLNVGEHNLTACAIYRDANCKQYICDITSSVECAPNDDYSGVFFDIYHGYDNEPLMDDGVYYIKRKRGAYGENSHTEGYVTTALDRGAHAEGGYTQAFYEFSHAEGYVTKSIGGGSHAEGRYTQSFGQGSHAEGYKTIAIGGLYLTSRTIHYGSSSFIRYFLNHYNIASAHAEGGYTKAFGEGSHAEGYQTQAHYIGSHAEGGYTRAYSDHSHAEGYMTIASGRAAHAEGRYNKSYSDSSHAEGYHTRSWGDFSHTEGYKTYTNAHAAHAEGRYTISTGEASHAEGYRTRARGNDSHAEGHWTRSYGDCSHSEGYNTRASGYASHSEGSGTVAESINSHAEGHATIASGINSHTEGLYTITYGTNAHAEGESTEAYGTNAHAEGYNTYASGNYSHTEGYKSKTGGSNSSNNLTAGTSTDAGSYAHAEGNATIGQGAGSHSEGKKTFASGVNSHAEGDSTKTTGQASHAEGYSTTASGNYAHVEGYSSTASGANSHAEGNQTTASNTNAHAEGNLSTASGVESHAEGDNTSASQTAAHAEGSNTQASGLYSHAEGSKSKAQSESSHAEGSQTTVSSGAIGGHAEGNLSTVSANYAHAEGQSTQASGNFSHAEGNSSRASGIAAHAEGNSTKGQGNSSHAEGHSAIASGHYSHAEGYSTTALGEAAHAEGNATIASGVTSHTEGKFTSASGQYTHAEGISTSASSTASHAEGDATTASGNAAHAEGKNTSASGPYSHTSGYYTQATHDSEAAFGQYNKSRTNTLFSVGCGTSSTRKNLFEIQTDGKIYFNGETYYIDGANYNGNSATATKLATTRNLKVNLASSSSQSFDGSADATSIGVTGTLPFTNLPTMYWANVAVSNQSLTNTSPQFAKIGINKAVSATYLLNVGGSIWSDNNIYISTGDNDRFIQFSYNTNNYAGASWRIMSRGTGSGDTNYFDIETGGSNSGANTWYRVIRLTMDNRYVGIGQDTPDQKLDVNGNSRIRGNNEYLGTGTGSQCHMQYDNTNKCLKILFD